MNADFSNLASRPANNGLDEEFAQRARSPVGAVREGRVLRVSVEYGTGYIEDVETHRTYSVTSKIVVKDFDKLKEGGRVRFQANAFNSVANLELLE